MVECTGLLIRRTRKLWVPRVRIPPSPLKDRSRAPNKSRSGLFLHTPLRRSVPVLLLCCLLAAGCTTRTLTITSDPDDASVLMDNRWIGNTPQVVEFRYGGVHELVFFKRGFATKSIRYDSGRLLFDEAPFDFFTDLGPWHAEDHQAVHVILDPSEISAAYKRDGESVRQGLRERAEILRARARDAQLAAPPISPLLPRRRNPPQKRP